MKVLLYAVFKDLAADIFVAGSLIIVIDNFGSVASISTAISSKRHAAGSLDLGIALGFKLVSLPSHTSFDG